MGKWLNEMCYIYNIEYYVIILKEWAKSVDTNLEDWHGEKIKLKTECYNLILKTATTNAIKQCECTSIYTK